MISLILIYLELRNSNRLEFVASVILKLAVSQYSGSYGSSQKMLNQVQHDKEGDDIFMTKTIKHIQKRDGRKVDFDPSKITNAIYKAFIATGEEGDEVGAEPDNRQ